jgi:hypothetical protein
MQGKAGPYICSFKAHLNSLVFGYIRVKEEKCGIHNGIGSMANGKPVQGDGKAAAAAAETVFRDHEDHRLAKGATNLREGGLSTPYQAEGLGIGLT